MKKLHRGVTSTCGILCRALGVAGWLLAASVLPAQAQTLTTMNLGGYLGVNYNGVANTYNAGYSMYVALLGRPQYAYYSPSFEASLEIGTWMGPTCNPGIYCDIEGGPGVGGGYGNHWCNDGFGIGAVAGDGFTNFVNGTSSGRGVGVYGGAQISPRLLYPPRLGLFRNGTKGQLVGYGYLALPLLPGKATTDGVNVPTGDHWWTLFFNTRNFSGPVTVVTPHFYSEVTKANTGAAGEMLDSCWAGPNKSIANESHYVPGKEYDGPEGSFLRVEPVFSAITHGTNGSIALNSPMAYDQTALWNAAQQWFTNNGPAPVGPFNAHGAALQTVTGGTFGWGIQNSPLGSLPMAMGATMSFYTPDSATYAYKWGTNQVTVTQFADGTPAAVMPEFYQLQSGNWTPVSAAAVPPQLASVSFDSGSPPAAPATYSVPSDSVWTTPGPAAGPFQARIEDGNVVTYYWYRFADQPAIMKAGLTLAERNQLQAAVVKIHSAWTNGGTYLAPPTMGTLAEVDPALLVTPPAGLEVGYVPIASNEFWGGWISFTWNQATSGNWSGASNWSSASAPEAGGHSYYRLTFSPSGSCVATNDLSNGYGYGGYAVNQLNFAGAVTLTGNPLTLTADVGSYPQINQNSPNGVMINTPLKLDVSTTLGGTGSGLVVLSNVVSGAYHSLTLNNSGTWRICGLTPNTYSGGTLIKSGTLIWGAVTNGVSPDCSQALGTGPVTLSSGATLQFEHANPTNALTLNGGTLYAANSAGVTWVGPITVNSNSTVRTDYAMGITGNISGARGLTKTGASTLTLSGVNTYTGANVVQAGTLSCSQPAALGGGALSVSNGAVADLNYFGTRTIFSLNLGGVNKVAGVYGSSNSPATYQDAHFSGTGTVTVPMPLGLTNLPATGITTSQATLNASLGMSLAYGGTNAGVLAYWGTSNGGTNPAAWANSAYVGKWANTASASVAYTATGLTLNTNTTYYFTFLATNAVYSVWATNVLSFTLPTKLAFTSVPSFPPAGFPCSVTVQAQDATGKAQNVIGATTVQLSKNSGSGTLSGTLSGTIANGSSSVTISGLVYSAADTMTLTATASSGMSLTAGVSPPITFMPPGLTWDANGTGAGVTDGTGNWLTTSSNWWNGTVNRNWADNFNARFGSGGTGGTITLTTPVTANLVTFTNFSGTYTLTGGNLVVVSNLTVANSAGSVVLGYIIDGPGGLTMNGSGSLRLYGLSPNTYRGGTVINRGTLIWGTMVNGISPNCNYALGTGPVTLNSGATLEFERVVATNALVLNGGTFWSQNGWGVTWSGPVTVNSNTTLQASWNMAFSGNISGPGGFTKTGNNTTTFSGTCSYTGPNVVQAGTFSCSQAASLGPGPLTITSGTVNLNYSGTRSIAGLTIGGTNLPAGIYGSTSSSATYKDSHFTGTGTVTVSATPAPIVSNGAGATNLVVGVAQLRGTLTNGPANVYLYWGPVDGGQTKANWANVSLLPGTPTGPFAVNVSNLLYGLTYYYRAYGSNANGSAWAPSTTNFTTLRPASTLSNAAATGIILTSAALNASLACTGATYNVLAYWGLANGGTNPASWANSAFVGGWTNVAGTNLSFTATGLNPSAPYYFNFRATNVVDSLWAANVLSFTTLTPPPPLVDNAAGATNLSEGVAQLQGTLTNGPADVRLYWGTTDAGTNGPWANSALLTNVSSGSFSNNVGGLLYGLTYYYRSYASNQWGAAWSPATVSFTTLKPAGWAGGKIPYGNMLEVAASEVWGGGYEAANAFNGNGLLLDGNTHTVAGCWVSTGITPVTNQWLKVRFDKSYPLDYLRLWAYNEEPQGSVTNAEVYVLDNAADPGNNLHLNGGPFNPTGWTLLLARQPLTPSPGLYSTITNTDPHIGLNGTTARQLAFKVKANAYAEDIGLAGFAEVQVYTLPVPAIRLTNSSASQVASSTAVLNGTLACSGAVYDVYACWNTVNGGSDLALWTNAAYVGSWTNVASSNLSYTATGLLADTTYYFTFRATNALDVLWATNVQSFTMLAPTPPPTPVLPVSGVTMVSGVPSFSFTAAAGCRYRLDYKAALTDAQWSSGPWSTNTSGVPSSMTLSDPSAAGQSQRFYRLAVSYP